MAALRRNIVAAIAILAVAALPANADDPEDDPICDRVILHLLPGVPLEDFLAVFHGDHEGVTLIPVDDLASRQMHFLVAHFAQEPDPEELETLAEDLEESYSDYLRSGEFLYPNRAPEGRTGSTYVDELPEQFREDQYVRTLLGTDEAQQRASGRGVVVAMLDTGVDATHPALAGSILPRGFNFVDGNSDVRDVGNGVDDDGDGEIDEMTGHGTFVAGLLAMTAPDAKLLPVRVLDSDGVGDAWILAKGFAYAIDQGAEVINLSLSTTYEASIVECLVEEAGELGIVVVAAAGNLDHDDPEEFPAMSSGGIGVAATDHEDVKADFSNYNEDLFISAPGDSGSRPIDPAQSIVSLLPGNEYAAWEGTSFATAFVSGTVALVRSQHPEWPDGKLERGDIVDAIRQRLEESAVEIYELDGNGDFAHDRELGVGRLDSAGAVALGPVAPPFGDLTGDGRVDFNDLLRLLADWNQVHSSADLDSDGRVAFGDLLILLGQWD